LRTAVGFFPLLGKFEARRRNEMKSVVQKHWLMPCLLLCLGCQSRVNQVEFVIPVGFRGTIILRHELDAPPIPMENGRYILKIPENGDLVYGGEDPFVSYLRTARFADGETIWVSTRGDRPQKDQIALFGGVTHRTWNNVDGYGVPDYRFFVGTEAQWENCPKEDWQREMMK
jgi:hypothetical protein